MNRPTTSIYLLLALVISAVALVVLILLRQPTSASGTIGFAVGHLAGSIAIFMISSILIKKTSYHKYSTAFSYSVLVTFCTVSIWNQLPKNPSRAVPQQSDHSSTIQTHAQHPVLQVTPVYPQGDSIEIEVDLLFKEYIQKSILLRLDYNAEISRIGWNRLFEPSRLKTDVNFLESANILREARSTLSNYQIRTSLLVAEVRDKVGRLPFSASDLKKAQVEYYARLESTRLLDLPELEVKSMAHFEGAIILLKNSRWQINGGRFAFDDDRDAESFNEYMKQIMNLEKERQKIQDAVSRLRLKGGIR